MTTLNPQSTELLAAGRTYSAALAAYTQSMEAFGVEHDSLGLNSYPPDMAPLAELQATFLAAQKRLLYAAMRMEPAQA